MPVGEFPICATLDCLRSFSRPFFDVDFWPILQIMKIKSRRWCIALLFLVPLPAGSGTDAAAKVEGVVLDINDARIWKTTLTFGNGVRDYSTKTRQDGTYSIELKPGTYAMEVKSYGFCTLRRSAFVLQKHSTVQFNLQMWVCPTDTESIQYIEFEEVPHTHLKPLVLYAKKDLRGELQRFRGPNAFDDGTGHPRQYPAIFTFNLLTVEAEEIVYDRTKHFLSAFGSVHWRDANNSGTSANVQIKLDGLNPNLLRYTESQQSPN